MASPVWTAVPCPQWHQPDAAPVSTTHSPTLSPIPGQIIENFHFSPEPYQTGMACQRQRPLRPPSPASNPPGPKFTDLFLGAHRFNSDRIFNWMKVVADRKKKSQLSTMLCAAKLMPVFLTCLNDKIHTNLCNDQCFSSCDSVRVPVAY